MKTNLLAFILLTFLSTFAFSQSQITLKNGDKIEGEIKSLLNGILTVKFQANNITLKQADIESIIMDKKSVPVSTINTKATVKGVVTYFFNNNYGDKPDVGAMVYLRKTDSAHQEERVFIKYKVIQVCKNSKSEFCVKSLEKYNATTKEGLEAIDKEAFTERLKLDMGENNGVIKATVDGNGNYSVNVDPGLYEIIFVSKGRTGMTITEIKGKLESKIIKVKSGETITSDFRFDIY